MLDFRIIKDVHRKLETIGTNRKRNRNLSILRPKLEYLYVKIVCVMDTKLTLKLDKEIIEKAK